MPYGTVGRERVKENFKFDLGVKGLTAKDVFRCHHLFKSCSVVFVEFYRPIFLYHSFLSALTVH